jgi:hypothetical protein
MNFWNCKSLSNVRELFSFWASLGLCRSFDKLQLKYKGRPVQWGSTKLTNFPKKLWPKNSSTTHIIHSESENKKLNQAKTLILNPKKPKQKKKNLTYNCRLKESVWSTQDFLTVTPDFLHPRIKPKKNLVKAFDDTDRLKTKYIEIDGNFDWNL